MTEARLYQSCGSTVGVGFGADLVHANTEIKPMPLALGEIKTREKNENNFMHPCYLFIYLFLSYMNSS